MAFNFALNPGDLSNPNGALPPGYTQSQIRSYFYVKNIANNVIANYKSFIELPDLSVVLLQQ